jgi:hypothetical protein
MIYSQSIVINTLLTNILSFRVAISTTNDLEALFLKI